MRKPDPIVRKEETEADRIARMRVIQWRIHRLEQAMRPVSEAVAAMEPNVRRAVQGMDSLAEALESEL